jgi:virginiamycin B lyase
MGLSTDGINGVLAIGLCAVMVAACSSGGASIGTSAMRPQSQSPVLTAQSTIGALSTKAANGNVTFAIGIHPKTKAGRITPKYVSPSTQSLQILTDGASPVVVNLTPSSPNCSPNYNMVPGYICRASLSVPAGNHVFTLTAYDLTGATGNILSTNITGTVYVKPIGTTTVPIALEGVMHGMILVLAVPNPPPGKAAAIGLTVIAEDADHNIIVGSASFRNPVTLTTTDSANGPLSKTVLKSSADALGITANYNGATVASITYSASATGLTGADVTNAILTPGNPTITEYPIPTAGSLPSGIAAGSDGALWFTEYAGRKIGRITTSGHITEYSIPSAAADPWNIAAGPDGALWFTEQYAGKIGRITTGGSITEYPIPTEAIGIDGALFGICAGPDGAMWFTDISGTTIGRITTSGRITEYPVPTNPSTPFSIVTGPDGALWFTEYGVGKIGRITTGGSFTEYLIPVSLLVGIAAGPDGALWFTDIVHQKIGRITIGGSVTEYGSEYGSGGSPWDIAAGPDGALWFSQGGNEIGRITTGGSLTEYPLPTANSDAWGCISGISYEREGVPSR